MDRILNSVRAVVEQSKHVVINEQALEAFAIKIKPEELNIPEFFERNNRFSLEQSIALGFVYNAVNFSYWGEPKWTVTVNGESYDGGLGMLQALQHGIESGYDLLSADYLRTIRIADLEIILKANVEIPLFNERLELLRKLGEFIVDNYNNSFLDFVDHGHWDAVKLVELLADDLPEVFNDEEVYNGKKVAFYKRAQLLPAHLQELFQLGISSREVTNMDQLTALADYKVPQLLRKYGVLEYASGLEEKIDNLIEVVNESSEEVEIRAATIWAVEQVTQFVRQRVPSVRAIDINHVLWLRGQKKSPKDKPYHRTRTIWY
jgi:hypothetical protein